MGARKPPHEALAAKDASPTVEASIDANILVLHIEFSHSLKAL